MCDYQEWWTDGELHREDGPAVIRYNGEKQWWLWGHRVGCSAAYSGHVNESINKDSKRRIDIPQMRYIIVIRRRSHTTGSAIDWTVCYNPITRHYYVDTYQAGKFIVKFPTKIIARIKIATDIDMRIKIYQIKGDMERSGWDAKVKIKCIS